MTEINGIKFQLIDKAPAEIERGKIIFAVLVGNYKSEQVKHGLIGSLLNDRRIKAVEMFCTIYQCNSEIGILV